MPTNNKWDDFKEGLLIILAVLGVVLYFTFFLIGKSKDCSNDGFTFNSITVRTND